MRGGGCRGTPGERPQRLKEARTSDGGNIRQDPSHNMKRIGTIIAEQKNPDRPKNLSTEFQVYGVYLAESLSDIKHYSLYIKLAKEYERSLLDEALTYTKAYTTAKSKAKIFMWRLSQLKKDASRGS